ncbi:MAG: MinD/ParA family protein [Deltaproteobacteria bacterium]|nr:MinD/ParA family protein [Deltaproteobacteria bacterium]
MGEIVDFQILKEKYHKKYMTTPAKVISITSGKGGVGKTHTTVNLGLALTKMGKKVLILDADLGLANVNILLGFKPGATIADLLSGEASMKDVIVKHSSGLDILPAASGITQIINLGDEQRQILLSAVGELGFDYDYLLVDTAAGIGDSVIYFNQAAEEIIVVINSEPTSLTDAYALIKVLATQHGITSVSVLINRNPVGADGRSTYAKLVAATEKFLSVRLKYLGAISEDEVVAEAVRSQQPYLSLYPSARASIDINKLAKKIVEDNSPRQSQGGLQFFFSALLENA